MEEKEIDLIANDTDKTERIDSYLSKKTDLSRAAIQKLIDDGKVTVNNGLTKSSYKIKSEDRIKVVVPPPKETAIEPQNIELNIVYEDSDIVVINKPPGMIVHPAANVYKDTLVNALMYQIKDLSSIGGEIKPGIVHRLDKDTSGLLVVAKNDKAHINLQKQIKDRLVKKIYLALVYGIPKIKSGIIEKPIGRHPAQRKKMAVIKDDKYKSRDATTHYKVLKEYNGYSLIELEIKTGRTHQIRVHLSDLGNPVVGDNVYSRKKNDLGAERQLLHAHILGFKHPSTGKYVEFTADIPEDFKKVLSRLD